MNTTGNGVITCATASSGSSGYGHAAALAPLPGRPTTIRGPHTAAVPTAASPPPTAPLARIYTLAADVLAKRGLCQFDFESPDGRVCTGEAIAYAVHELRPPKRSMWEYDALEWLSINALAGQSVIGWNDTDGRTLDQALRMLRRAAAQVTA